MPPVIAAITTLILDVIILVVLGLVLLIAMNGYSERSATLGLAAYALISLGSIALAGYTSFSLAGLYLRRKFSNFGAGFLAMSIGTMVGAAIMLFASFIGVAVAEYARTHN